MRPDGAKYVAAILVLAAGTALCGCAWSRNLRADDSQSPAREAVSIAANLPIQRQPDSLANKNVGNTDAFPVRTASLAGGELSHQTQPETVPAPQPSHSLPLLFTEGTTLAELEHLAEERHPKLMAAMQEIEAAHGRTWQAGRMPNPTLGASSPQLAGSESQYNVFVAQEIPTGGKLRLNAAAAGEEIDQAELSLSRTRQGILTSVRQHFYSSLVAQARARILADQVTGIRRSVELVRKRFEGTGEGTKTDILLLEVDLQKAEVALTGAQTELETARRQLAAALGVPNYPLTDLAGNLEAEVPLAGVTDLADRVVAGHTQTAIAATEIRRRQLLVDRAYAEPKPTFNLQGGYQRQVGPPQDQGILQLTMSVPLWDRNYGGIQAAQAQAMKAQAELARIETELASQAAAAQGRYAAAEQLVVKYRDAILPKTRESLSLATRLYEGGETDFQSLLHTQQAHAEAQLKYLEALSARWQAAIEIADLLQLERFP